MALQVWLPFTKDSTNQGLLKLSMSAATMDNNGKLGKCAIFQNTNYAVVDTSQNKTVHYTDNFSWCGWFNPNYSGDINYAFTVGRADTGSYGYGLQIVNVSDAYVRFGTSNYTVSCPSGSWTHLCFVKSGTNIKIYKNGSIYTDTTFSGTMPTYSSSEACGLGVGCFYYSSGSKIYSYSGKINDFRIYDHCLSPKEVKEISKGLVLHYPLNDAYVEGTTNIASNLSPSQIGGWQKMTITKLSTNNYHLKHQTSDSANLSYWSTFVYTLPSEYSNKTISFSARIKNIAYNDIKDSSWLYIGPGNNGQYPTHGSATFYCYELKENQLISWTGVLSNNNRYVLVELWNDANSTSGSIEFDLADIQIEEKDHVTPYTLNTRNETIVHDCSGYQNNGTVSDNITLSVDSPRYIGSYKFIPNAMISTPGIVNFDKCTYSVWCKDPNMSYKIVFCDGTSKVAFGESSGFLCSCGSNSQNKFTKNNWKNSDWNHVVVVRDGSTYKMYINGEAETQSGTADYWNHSASTITVGGREENAAMWNGNISDFRIYTTALSADDIKELYNTSAYVLDNGTLLTYNLEE